MNSLTHITGLCAEFASWASNTRASVSVEVVLGAILIITTTVGALDLYRVVGVRSLGLKAAATMADYVSLETAPKKAFIRDLAKFLHEHEISAASDAAFVVSAVTRPSATDMEPNPKAVVTWTSTIVVSKSSTPSPDLRNCRQVGDEGKEAKLPTALAMEPGEEIVVAELCIKLLSAAFVSGGILPDGVLPSFFYRQQIRSVRTGTLPTVPS